MASFYGRRYFDESDSLAHFFYTGNSGNSIKSSIKNSKDKKEAVNKTSASKESGGTHKKRDLGGTSISDERGTDGKQNNTSEYNHEYYEENPEKWQDNETSSSSSKKTKSSSKSKKKTKEETKSKEEEKTSEESNDQNDEESTKEKSILDEKDLDEVALDVIRGKYGNGSVRREALGKDYTKIQRRVNELMAANKKAGIKESSINITTTPTKRNGEGGGSRI